MATITEILESQGIQLTDELKEKLPGLVEGSDEVNGLVKVKEDLLNQKAKARAESERMEGEISSLTTKMQEYKAKAEQAQSVEEELQALRDMNKAESERATLLAEKNQQINGKRATERKGALLDGLAGKFKNQLMAKGALASMIDVSFDEDGNLTESFKGTDGSTLEVSDSKGFFEYISGVEDFASEIKAPTASGAKPAGGSGSHTASPSQTNANAEAAKKSGDQIGHLNALFAQNLKGNA